MTSGRSIGLWAVCALAAASAAQGGAVEDCDRVMAQVGGPCVAATSEFSQGKLAEPHRDIAGFVLGRDSFQKALKIFGPARRWRSGKASAAESKICYLALAGEKPVTLVLAAGSATAGARIDSLRLIEGRLAKAQSCSQTGIQAATSTRSGLALGMTRDELERILGSPTAAYVDIAIYAFCQERVLKPADTLYASCRRGEQSVALRCSGVTARFESDILKWIDIGYGANEAC